MITVNSVSFSYSGNEHPAVDEISLSIPSGGVVGLVGSNGSGKSTLLKLIAGIYRPQSGEIELGGHAPHSRGAKQEIITLTGNENLPDFLTGRELIQLYSSLYQKTIDLNSLNSLANRYSLQGWLDSLIEDYSHGMKKKLLFICALLMKRKVTILDETLNGVDFHSLLMAKRDIQMLAQESTIILCTHDNFLTEGIVDRYIGLKDGCLRIDISSQELELRYHSVTSLLQFLVKG